MAILNHLNGDDSNHPLEKNGTCTRRWTHHRKRLKVGSLWASFRRRDGWIVDFLLGSILLVLLIIHTLDIIFCILCIYLSYIDLIYIHMIYIYTHLYALCHQRDLAVAGLQTNSPAMSWIPFFERPRWRRATRCSTASRISSWRLVKAVHVLGTPLEMEI